MRLQCPLTIMRFNKGFGKRTLNALSVMIPKVFECEGLYCITVVVVYKTSAVDVELYLLIMQNGWQISNP